LAGHVGHGRPYPRIHTVFLTAVDFFASTELRVRSEISMSASRDPARELLRHIVATVAYRGGKTLRGAPASFANFQSANNARTPAKILAHICDLFD
jgi:hypothetical protein